MPRNARKEVYSDFFHVMIQGINKEYIFKNEVEINTYLKYLKEKNINKKLQIIAYCIMNNHAHFLIYTKNIMEISKLMSQVNTKYAIFYNKLNNRCGFVFRNRYKSEQILTYSHLISCINYIHNNPVKAKMCTSKDEYKYSSYNEYMSKGHLLNIDEVLKIFKENNINIDNILKGKCEMHKFIEHVEYDNKEDLKKYILEEFYKRNNINDINDVVNNRNYIKELSTMMYIDYNFTQKEIGEILGLNRLKIHRILHEL